MSLSDRLKHAWNAFSGQTTEDRFVDFNYGSEMVSYGTRPDMRRSTFSNDRSIISTIYTRLSVDVAAVSMQHVRLDESDRYLENIDSGLNECLNIEANIDQPARAFRQDIAMTLFDKGVAAIVPVETTINPRVSAGYDIKSLRVGEIVSWYPKHVKVRVYNENKGQREEIVLEKRFVAIVENPLYSIMNEPNSTLQRLIRKLTLMDTADEQVAAGKMDLIIQLPYVIKSETRREQAEKRRKDIEFQLSNSKYGIAYTDGTERITQLNRPVENTMLKTVEYLTNMLYSQLGLTPEILNGTANEQTMLNYNHRTVEPVLDAIAEAMKCKFLTKTARTQKQSIMYFRDPAKMVPITDIAEMADKFTRNEILTSNEIRTMIGFKPSNESKADMLQNSNMPTPTETGNNPGADQTGQDPSNQEGDSQNGS